MQFNRVAVFLSALDKFSLNLLVHKATLIQNKQANSILNSNNAIQLNICLDIVPADLLMKK